jgi:hypothetical protein
MSSSKDASGAPIARDVGDRRDMGLPVPERTTTGEAPLAQADGSVGEAGDAESGIAVGDEGTAFDVCSIDCSAAAPHLLISEIVTRPSGAEMIEIVNPTSLTIDLTDYWISDSHLYEQIASGGFSTASGSDFAARFPPASQIGPGEYRTISLANASGGSTSFSDVYGLKPDFELRPTAHGAVNDGDVPDMLSSDPSASIGTNASLTDSGEPVVLFFLSDGARVYDVDYVFYGAISSSNLVVDKSGQPGYEPDTPASLQTPAPAPGESGSLQRCDYAEVTERRGGGNGITGHDETSEDASRSFVLTTSADMRTPGGPPPAGACTP